MKALVPLSGGLDSAVVLAGCVGSDLETATVGFDYGQPHRIELQHAERIAGHYCVPFEIVALPMMPLASEVVFAGRNLVFASVAVSMAQARGIDIVAFGCNSSDWFDFPDCRPEFWRAFKTCAGAYGVQVRTPLLHNPKPDIVKLAFELKVPITGTWSCYGPGPEPCGECLACRVRADSIKLVEEGKV